MSSDKYHRKRFLTFLSSATAASILPTSVFPFSADTQANSFVSGPDDNDFFLDNGLTYLNTGTLGPCRKDTIEESLRAWKELESYPVKFYGKFGAEALAEKTRSIAASFLGCDLSEIMITTSTTNGMNAIAQGLRLKAGDHILTTDQEHGGGLLCWNYFVKYYGVTITKINIPPGENNAGLILQRIKDNLRPNTKLISVSHVFSSTGLLVPLAEICSLAKANGTLCIVDGAQSVGAIEVDLKKLGCHAYATSGHKWLMGPKGTGLLYISKDARDLIRPIQFEESHNTYSDGNGVVNLGCILGLGKAIEYLESLGMSRVAEHNLLLRNHLFEKLKDLHDIRILSPEESTLASPMLTVLLPAKYDKGQFVKMLLDKYKLSIRPTHKEFGFNGIRFSIHIFNTQKEIDYAVEIMHKELT